MGSLAVASAGPRVTPTPPKKMPPPKKEPPKADRHWRVFEKDKQCFADNSADACPPQPAGKPAPPCNPPVPTKYECPKNVTLPVNVIQRAGATECFVDYGPMDCPAGARCNPPPPRKLACP
ncbi:MAG: hypothetical protein H0T46_23575 [Deltaproteobacteria bacterium]|nr:hypothetical protein [Deltaproteobacteria bacterium]